MRHNPLCVCAYSPACLVLHETPLWEDVTCLWSLWEWYVTWVCASEDRQMSQYQAAKLFLVLGMYPPQCVYSVCRLHQAQCVCFTTWVFPAWLTLLTHHILPTLSCFLPGPGQALSPGEQNLEKNPEFSSKSNHNIVSRGRDPLSASVTKTWSAEQLYDDMLELYCIIVKNCVEFLWCSVE